MPTKKKKFTTTALLQEIYAGFTDQHDRAFIGRIVRKHLTEKGTPRGQKKSPIADLVPALKRDKEYWHTWKANIAMAFYDEYRRAARKKKCNMSMSDLHLAANNAAEYFLKQLCGKIKYPKGR